MIHWLLAELLDSFFAQVGIAGLVLVCCVLVFLYVPGAGARHLAVAVGSVCVVFLFLAPKLYLEGVSHERAEWVAKVEAERDRAARARTDAEQEIPPDPPAEPEPPAAAGAGRGVTARPGRVRDDRYDRDNK